MAFACVAVVGSRHAAPHDRTDDLLDARRALVAAEDRRAAGDQDLNVLLEGLEHRSPEIVRTAVRGLGRLERPSLLTRIAPLLRASSSDVRADAADALAQAVASEAPPGAIAEAMRLLTERASVETDPIVRAAVFRSLGRLPYKSPDDIREVEGVLSVAVTAGPPDASVVGAVKGLDALARAHRDSHPLSRLTVDRLKALIARVAEGPSATEARRLSLRALAVSGDADVTTLQAAAADADEELRRVALAAAAEGKPADGEPMVRNGLRDRSPRVRYEAVRSYGRWLQAGNCAPVLSAVDDPNPHISLLAIDLAGGCTDSGASERLQGILDETVEPGANRRTSQPGAKDWHRPAHALVALAKQTPDRAREVLSRFAGEGIWQARMYAARAAEALGDAATLKRLAADQHHNVSEAALAALSRVEGHLGDEVYRAALKRSDYQLILAAVAALEGTSARREAASALLDTLDRVTSERRDTSRDPRIAIVRRLREVGGAGDVRRLGRYLADFDPRVAGEAARTLEAWTGRPHTPSPARRAGPEAPSAAELAALSRLCARVTMRERGAFELRFFDGEAPVTVARFVSLARAGYYDGLTFHRVVPNFVIQGGSPGANEYMGDGDFWRDEVGLRSHTRGTLGISTRGRDTGDGQIFVNLVDNTRLDHAYTVFAEIENGMGVVDAILEGDAIDRIEIRQRP